MPKDVDAPKPKKAPAVKPVKLRNTIMVIEPPVPEAPGEHLLILARFDGMSGLTRSVVFIAVDHLERTETYIRGFLGTLGERHLVVEFPAGTAYMLLRRDHVRFVSPLEVGLYEKGLDEVMRSKLGEPHSGHLHPMNPEQLAEMMAQGEGGKVQLPIGQYL